ncbi:MAG: FkbM family methyltransferase, partial [Candidatus Lokiarchaeota archaeon]|nr:FkbM family methyltransferase [Candidatus Lokiarchaeota archaeon]
MSFISYSDNSEDVILFRALKHIEKGFYVDVGAHHPLYGSVTKSFYDRGWRGVNIEPVSANFKLFEMDRPEDINLNIAVSDKAGDIQFFEIIDSHQLDTALSTTRKEYADRLTKDGVKTNIYTVPCTTLDMICEENNINIIHFLKIDVEGAEKSVLQGFSFEKVRPWILMVEANEPYSTKDVSHEWESLILTNNYEYVYYDGLNKFYLAQECLNLQPYFSVQANVFDDYIGFREFQLQKEIKEIGSELKFVTSQLEQVYASTSWQITKPLRTINYLVMKVVPKLKRILYPVIRYYIKRMMQYKVPRKIGGLILNSRPKIKNKILRVAGMMPVPQKSEIGVPRENVIKEKVKIHDFAPEYTLPKHCNKIEYRIKNIHQFHPGSGYGDAITNAMFLIQRILRNWGYQSEIYVNTIDPRIDKHLKLFTEYTGGTDQLLLVHHSMGFDGLDQVLQVPDLKILIYHNITPVNLLNDMPYMQAYAELGRNQLLKYRDYVIGSIADSPFNALELTELGYKSSSVIPLLIDIEDFTKKVKSDSHSGQKNETFTVLFVGRVVRSKGQCDLVRSFAEFSYRYDEPCQLVLVGKAEKGENDYLSEVKNIIKSFRVEGKIIITGQVSDEDLIEWYRKADLYVSMSEHEGFCVPMLEAMAANVPILAFPVGAIPWVLANDYQLLKSREPEYVCEKMYNIATNKQERERIIESQKQQIENFKIIKMREKLSNYLGECGIRIFPESNNSNLIRPHAYTIAGHINGSYSLAIVNRQIAMALERKNPGKISIFPYEESVQQSFHDIPGEEYRCIFPLINKTVQKDGISVLIVNHFPPMAVDFGADVKLAFFFWEESIVSEEIINLFNANYHGMLVASKFAKKVLIDSGIKIPVSIVWLGIDHFVMPDVSQRKNHREKFRFLHVSSGFPRKGIDVLLKAYALAFNYKDPVELVLKTFPNQHNETALQIESMQNKYSHLAPIKLINKSIGKKNLAKLYLSSDAVVLPTRGEGFNLPAAEAMFYGVPVITTAYGAQTEFCTERTAWLVDYNFDWSRSHLKSPNSMWIEPDQKNLAKIMMEVFEKRNTENGEIKRRVESGQQLVSEVFTWAKTAESI